MISHSLPNSGLPVPVKIKTDGGFDILIIQLPICDFWSGCNITQSTHRYGPSFDQECEKSGE